MDSSAESQPASTTHRPLLRRCLAAARRAALVVSTVMTLLLIVTLSFSHGRSHLLSYYQQSKIKAELHVYVTNDVIHVKLADLHYILRDLRRAQCTLRLYTNEPPDEPERTAIATAGRVFPGYIGSIYVGRHLEGFSGPLLFGHTEKLSMLTIPLWFAIAVFAAGPIGWLCVRRRVAPRRLWSVAQTPFHAVRRHPMTTLAALLAILVALWANSGARAAGIDVRKTQFSTYNGAIHIYPKPLTPGILFEAYSWPVDRKLRSYVKEVFFSPSSLSLSEKYWPNDIAYWILFILLLSVVASSFVGRFAHRQIPEGFCQTCGYDLRASVGFCPECGADPALPPRQMGRLTRMRNGGIAFTGAAVVLLALMFFAISAFDAGDGAKFTVFDTWHNTPELSITRWQMTLKSNGSSTVVSTFVPVSVMLAIAAALFYFLYRSINAHRAPSR